MIGAQIGQLLKKSKKNGARMEQLHGANGDILCVRRGFFSEAAKIYKLFDTVVSKALLIL
jgi:hypothetical protein